jgi:hypothetical protein
MTVKWNGEEVMAKVRAGAMRGVIRGTERVHDLGTRKIMDPPKTGKKYSGLPNRSSAPGEAPATQSGGLQRSGMTRYDVASLTGTATWTAAQALRLEVGDEIIASRPFARPALAESVEGIRTDVDEEIRKALAS